MAKNKDTIHAAIVTALLIALMALALIGAFGVVTVNAEESSSPATFDFPAATKFIGEGDTYTVNYYAPSGAKIAEQTLPYGSAIPLILGCNDYDRLFAIGTADVDNAINYDGVTADDSSVLLSVMYETGIMTAIYDGQISLLVIHPDITILDTLDNFVVSIDYSLNGEQIVTQYDSDSDAIQLDDGTAMFILPSTIDDEFVLHEIVVGDVVITANDNVVAMPVAPMITHPVVDVANIVVNDYVGDPIEFYSGSTEFVAGTQNDVTVNYFSPDLKKISSTTITADQTIPVLDGYDNYTLLQTYSQGDGTVISIDGVTVDFDDSIVYSKYGVVYEHTGKSYPHTMIFGDYSDIVDVDVPYEYNISGSYMGFDRNFVGSNSSSGQSFIYLLFGDDYIQIGDNQGTHDGFNSFSVNGYDYVRADGLMQFPYTAEQLAGFTPNTDVINLIVDDYVAPEPDDPTPEDPTPTPGGDTGEIDQPGNPTVTAPDGNWFTETWDKIVQWFKDAGEAIKNWFIEVGQWFKDLFN